MPNDNLDKEKSKTTGNNQSSGNEKNASSNGNSKNDNNGSGANRSSDKQSSPDKSNMSNNSSGSSGDSGTSAKAKSPKGEKGGLKGALKDSMKGDSGQATNANGGATPEAEEVQTPQRTPMQKAKTAKNAVKAGEAAGKGYSGFALWSKFLHMMQMMAGMLTSGVSSVVGGAAAFINAVIGFFQGVGAAIGGFFMGIGSAVAGFFGIGTTTATVVVATFVATATVTGGASAIVMMNNNIALRDNNVADCAEGVLNYGVGHGTIPEKVGDLRVGYVTTWEASLDWMNSHISKGTAQRNVVDLVVANGSTDDKDFVRLGEYYIVAIAPTPFGVTEDVDARVGDYITFYLSDGTAIECIVGDTKGDVKGNRRGGGTYNFRENTPWDEIVPIDTPTGPAQISAYGHTYNNDVNVLEFWGISNINNHYERITGKKGLRVESFTNHGYAKEYVSFVTSHGGSIDTSNASTASASANKRGASKDNCVKTRNYDNSSIAKAAISYAWPTADKAESNDGTDLYQKLHRAIFPGDDYFQSCDRSVATAVRWSGADDDFPAGPCLTIMSYCESSDRWKNVGTNKTLKVSDLQPGDILVSDGHVLMFVGEELVKEMKGDEAKAGSNSVSGSIGAGSVNRGSGSRSPGVDMSATWYMEGGGSGTLYHVYRCVNPMNSDKYSHAAD